MELKGCPEPLNAFLALLRQEGGSDLHLREGENPMIRDMGGHIKIIRETPLTADEMVKTLGGLLSKAALDNFKTKKEADDVVVIEGVGRFRINAFISQDGVGVVCRVLKDEIPTVEALNLSESIVNFVNLESGLVLITGPNNAGKTTMLTAMLEHVNRNYTKHIVTIENPVEFVFDNKKSIVDQRELGTHTNSYAEALSHVVRQDTDIVSVAELRDRETIESCLSLAESGYLVFATVHTQNVVQALGRIIDIFSREKVAEIRTILSMVLQGVVCQKLIQPKEGQRRIPIQEIMTPNVAMRYLIRQGSLEQLYNEMQTDKADGNVTFDDYLKVLYRGGVIDTDKALHYCHFPELMADELGLALPKAG